MRADASHLGETVQAVLDAGFTLTQLAEGDTLDRRFAPWMEPADDGTDRWVLPVHQREKIATEFTREAVRPA